MVDNKAGQFLQAHFNPGMTTWVRRKDGRFDFISSAHDVSYKGTCDARDVAIKISDSHLSASEIIRELEILDWNDVLLFFHLWISPILDDDNRLIG